MDGIVAPQDGVVKARVLEHVVALVEALFATDPEDEYTAERAVWGLAERYGESHRAYHTLDHVADCLAELDGVHGHASLLPALEAALWYHDVVYEVRHSPDAPSSEARSAWLATQRLGAAGPAPMLEAVAELILATAHLAPELDHAAACVASDVDLLIDIDLSILGRSPEVFARYDRAVRQEYAWLDEERYRTGRAAVLEGFLGRATIYRTTIMRARYEEQARANIAGALAALTGDS